MQKTLVILTCVLFFGALATSEASPLDSPDIVYIDGQPCNSACQSYMAWSRQMMPVPGQPPRVRARAATHQQLPNAAARRATRIREAGSRPVANDRLAKQAAPTSTEMPQAKTTDKAAATADTAGAKVADSASTVGTATHSAMRTTLEQVTAAVAVAERLTATTTVAIVIARPEIKSVSDLAGKSIAIDNGQSVSSDSVRTAIAKAGAAEVHLTENQAKALGRMIGGEVPAAVLTLASPEAAEGFPEVAGFKIFRIPLTREISRAKNTDSQPAANTAAASDAAGAKIAGLPSTTAVTTDPHTRTTQELVTAATAVAERITASQGVEKKTNTIESSDRPEAAISNDTDPRIAILMARPEIKSVSDLTGKEIAIDGRLSAASNRVRTAIAAAAEVQLDESQAKALGRMIGGEVPAAVLTLASPEAAEGFPEVAGFKIFRIPLTPEISRAKNTDSQPAANAAAASDAAGAKIAGLPSTTAVATAPHTRTTQELVTAATAVAERITAAMAAPQGVEKKANITDSSDHPETTLSNDIDPRIAILVARPEIKSVFDLSGKEIAIDGKLFAATNHLRTAIAAAGAAEVQLDESQTNAIDRVIGGAASAAVLTLASPEASEGFPEVAGFRILRIPISPHSILTRKP
jgi:TRAP-type uncharacterized transport system substrate-binding protein